MCFRPDLNEMGTFAGKRGNGYVRVRKWDKIVTHMNTAIIVLCRLLKVLQMDLFNCSINNIVLINSGSQSIKLIITFCRGKSKRLKRHFAVTSF